ncbi:MAG TPA: nicotinate-nucleotide diphosphorylase (carboxylating), partial [Anaerolineae bacterium]|nr:nicotinate-nucleotide diphosphorylase (carboxylating) [Anaerolineae bacterium]
MTQLMDQIDAIIRNALVEDVGSGDVTTLNTVPAEAMLRGTLLVKADGVVAGLAVFQRVFELVDQ